MRNNHKDLACRASPKHVLFSTVVTADDANNTLLKTAHEPARQDTNPTSAATGYGDPHPGSHAFDTVPKLVKTPWELERPVTRSSWPIRGDLVENCPRDPPAEKSRREWTVNRWPRSLRRGSNESQRSKPQTDMFDRLPEEVCQSILDGLDALHNAPSVMCADCLLDDVHSLSLVSKKWQKATSCHMYTNLWLPGYHDGWWVKRRNRARLLLRTLQERPDLARKVHRIYAPAILGRHKLSDRKKSALTVDLAEIVLLCPNLQAFMGMYSKVCNGQPLDELTAALVTRDSLRQHVWLLEARGEAPEPPVSMSFPVRFKCHARWTSLETLVIHESGGAILGPGSIYGILRQLPALQHLALVGLSRASFHDGTLQALTGLRSLRLEALEGLSDLGLEQALPKLSASLQSLGLIDLDIKTLRAVSTLLTTFTKLERLTFVQDGPPGLPLGADVFQATDLPLVCCPTLTYLHWETLAPGSANQALETSIRAGGFPSLRKLRAPCDSDGGLQALCRPLARRALSPAEVDAYGRQDARQAYTRDLAYARTAAQLRVRDRSRGRHTPAVSVVVQEEQGHVHFTHLIGRYLGDVRSRIEYNLDPDYAGTSEALGRVEHLVDECDTFECTATTTTTTTTTMTSGGNEAATTRSSSSKRRKGTRHVGKRRREVHSLF